MRQAKVIPKVIQGCSYRNKSGQKLHTQDKLPHVSKAGQLSEIMTVWGQSPDRYVGTPRKKGKEKGQFISMKLKFKIGRACPKGKKSSILTLDDERQFWFLLNQNKGRKTEEEKQKRKTNILSFFLVHIITLINQANLLLICSLTNQNLRKLYGHSLLEYQLPLIN